MRSAFAIALLALAAAAFWMWGAMAGGEPPGDGPDFAAPAAGQPAAAIPAGTHATRLAVPPTPTPELAAAPTAWLRVVDHRTAAPLPAASIRLVQTGAVLAFTDERGLAGVPLLEPTQLAVVLDDYLLRLAPTQPGSTELEPQTIHLVRDEWSPRVTLELVGPGSVPLDDVFVRLRPGDAMPSAAPPVPAGDALLQRAWTEHRMLAGRPVCRDVPIQRPDFDAARVHRLGPGAEVRFVAAGAYELEAATTTGLVGRCEVIAAPSPTTTRVALIAGVAVAGVVVRKSDGAPLGGATLELRDGDPLGLVATTAADGRFELAPLWPAPVVLLARCDHHEARAFGPVLPPQPELRIPLTAAAGRLLRGRVRQRPDLAPIAGAAVVWQPPGGSVSTARTAADGTFELVVTGDVAARLVVQAPDFLPYAELVAPEAPFADYDLWPARREVRVARSASALLQGIVVDADGRPQAGVAVRWRPAAPPAPEVPAFDRRMLDGAVLELPLVATTDADGIFRLETTRFGPGRLSLVDDDQIGVAAVAAAGSVRDDLRLQR